MSPQLSSLSSPLSPPQPTLPPPLLSSPLSSTAAWRRCHRSWRHRHRAWCCCRALHCRVRATSLVLSPKGVALLVSMALLPSVELSPSLVLVSSSPSLVTTGHGIVTKIGVVTQACRRHRRACTERCGIIAERHGVVTRAWHCRHCCCHRQWGDNKTMFRGCWIWE